MGTAGSSTTVQAQPSPFSAVGGETTFFKRCADLVHRLAHVQPPTVLPPPTLLLGKMLPVFYTVGGAILYCATPPTLLLGLMLPVLDTLVREALLFYPPLHYSWH